MNETMRQFEDMPAGAEGALDFDAAFYEKWERVPELAGVDILRHSLLWHATDADMIAKAIAHCRPLLKNVPARAEFSIMLCDDAEIAALNRVWRGKDSATNVLSFPTPPGPARALHIGDIAIAYEITAREAAEMQKSFQDHLAHLTVHGLLHLAGFDHSEEVEAEAMERFETDVLAGLGIADPYQLDAANVRARFEGGRNEADQPSGCVLPRVVR